MEQQQNKNIELTIEEQKQTELWIASHLSTDVLPPFSFTYGGKKSSEFLKDWQFSQETKQIDDTRTERILIYTDPQTSLEVRCICTIFSNFPAVEWVVTFYNKSNVDTPIIEDVQSLDTGFIRKENGEFILHRALGSSAAKTDFAPINDVMSPNAKIQLSTIGGRSSNTIAFPFFNIEMPGEGIIVAIGWSGQWVASLIRDSGTGLMVRAGMELTHLKLHPGEEIRTPSISLLFWQGEERLRGHNLFRQFILRHHTPIHDGKPVNVPLACMDRRHGGEEANKATEQDQIEFGKCYAQYGVEYLWIDAGWFEGGWPSGVGNWFVRKNGFPNGLRPVSDAVKKVGMGFVIWFEPERVYQGTWLDREHPDWIIKLPGSPTGLLNLGNPEALHWLIEHISGMIQEEGINVYRQDFNMEPLPYWRSVDSPDRQGITEIRYIEGLYKFWDELLTRNPGLIIDNCASGGRRIDLETTSRSVPLWRTDYNYGEPNGQQSHTHGVNFYIPTTSTGCLSPDTYSFRSAMTAGLCLCPTYDWSETDLGQVCRLIGEFKRLRPFFYGDYYPLTAHSIRDDVWIGYQFHREDMKAGMFLVFRRSESPYLSARLKLGGILPSARYEFTYEDTGIKQVLTGETICAGIDVTIDDAPGSLLATYKQLI